MKTWDYLERVRALNDGCSDYRLSQILGVVQQAMTKYRQRREMDDDVCLRVASILNLPPLRVIADVRRARAELEENADLVAFWGAIADTAASSNVVVMPRVPMADAAPAVRKNPVRAKRRVAFPRGFEPKPPRPSPRPRRFRRVRRRVMPITA